MPRPYNSKSDWAARNLATASCHVSRAQYDQFRAICAAAGTRPYRVLQKAIIDTIRRGCYTGRDNDGCSVSIGDHHGATPR